MGSKHESKEERAHRWLAWKGASGARLQLQSALSARHTRYRHAPDIQALTIALCCFRCESGKTGKRAQSTIQRCCHWLLQ